jgi:hypothetical protein
MAVGFTGSRAGGLALVKLAQAREVPIPVYAEMSSINPVVLMPAALKARGEALGEQFVGSLTMGAGQFCTNPGLILAIEGEGLDAQGALCPTCRGDGLPAQARAFGVAGQPLSAWLGRPITALEPLLAEAGATGRALGPAIEAAHQAGLADHGFGTPLRALGPGLALRLRLAALGARPLTGSALLIERPSAILPALALDDVAAQARRWIEAGGSVFVEDDHPRWRDLADTVVDLGGAPLPSVSPHAPAPPRGRLLLDLQGLAGPGAQGLLAGGVEGLKLRRRAVRHGRAPSSAGPAGPAQGP